MVKTRRTRRKSIRPSPATSRATRRARPDEAGASLVLALVFLVIIGTIVGGIASWTANALGDTIVFQNASKVQSALLTASNTAIQTIRYNPMIGLRQDDPQTLNANPPAPCFGTSSTSQVDPFSPDTSYTVDVWCSTVWNPTSQSTRIVTVSACLSSNDSGNASTSRGQPWAADRRHVRRLLGPEPEYQPGSLFVATDGYLRKRHDDQ